MVLSLTSFLSQLESVLGGEAVADEAHIKILRVESADAWNK